MTFTQHGGGNRFPVPSGNLMRIGDKAGSVKLHRQKSLGFLGMEKREQGFEDGKSFSRTDLSYEQLPVFRGILQMSRRIQPHRKSESPAEKADRSRIGHFDTNAENVTRRTTAPFVVLFEMRAFDSYATFTIYQSGTVSQGKFGSVYYDFLH